MKFSINCLAQSSNASKNCIEVLLDAARFLEEELQEINVEFIIEVVDSNQENKLFHSTGGRIK